MSDRSTLIVSLLRSPKLPVLLLCTIVVISYTFKALQESHPQQVSYSNWLNSNFPEEENLEQLSRTVFTVHFPDQLGALTWQLTGSSSDAETNRKLKRLMELAKSSSVFAEGNSSISPDKITVTLVGPNKSFSANLTRKQIERVPELQTFFKLFELYANSNGSNKENLTNENS